MSEIMFTRGPWRVGGVEGYNANIITVGDVQHQEEGVCMIYSLPMNTPYKDVDTVRYAKPLANAPELYAALEELEWSDNGRCPQCGVESMRAPHQKNCKLNNALLKARGEQQ
jgi:hypothetical protein